MAVTKDVDKAEPWAVGCQGELTGWKSGTRSLWPEVRWRGQRLGCAARKDPGPGDTGGGPGTQVEERRRPWGLEDPTLQPQVLGGQSGAGDAGSSTGTRK